ncbi:glutathione S-transferase family protein [Limnobacter sp.]|uniref:glutathione S-transferase family protein n=1 Tax=Limnobacter sp. TaxID=2003368 RepID=UPI002736BE30|nr:glutathione S-transferase family protein [Limnobacter sp.]MDP3187040.1 glutathione S-transferase family protein [Limnobacter sp.]
MKNHYTLYGWHLSYFTGKALCYLRYKQVDHVLKPVNLYTLTRTIKRKTGAAVMPVLKTPSGIWIQDTSEIIDYMESLHHNNPVTPNTPVQEFASLLLEAWGDEWWVPIAMHTRWNYPENYALFQNDAGKALMPWAPQFIQHKMARQPATMLRGMLPFVGIVPEQFDTMNTWTTRMLDTLDAHFKVFPFLLGARPSLGDFGLVGTMYGHLGRDPWPKRELIDPRKHLSAWLQRMKSSSPFALAQLVPNDEIPATLNDVFHSVFHEFIPMVAQIGELATAHAKEHGLNVRLPRRIGEVTTTMGGKPFKRGALPYMIWMLQRAIDRYDGMAESDKKQVRAWLQTHQAEHVLNLNLPRVERMALTVAVSELPKQHMEQTE